MRYPLVLCDPYVCEGNAKHVEQVLRTADVEPLIAERVASSDVMMVLVAAGLALGLTSKTHITSSREAGVVARPLAGQADMITTYLLRPASDLSDTLARFIERACAIGAAEPEEVGPADYPHDTEDIGND